MALPDQFKPHDEVNAEPIQDNFSYVESVITTNQTNINKLLGYMDNTGGHSHNGAAYAGKQISHGSLSNTDLDTCHPQYALNASASFNELRIEPSKIQIDNYKLFKIRQFGGPEIFNVTYAGNSTLAGSLTIGGNLNIAGGVTFGGDVDVTGDLDVGGYSSITGSQEIGDYLKVTGFADLNGTMDVADYATFQDNVDVVGAVDLKGASFYKFGGNDIRANAISPTVGITEAIGTADQFAREDHSHKLSTDNTNITILTWDFPGVLADATRIKEFVIPAYLDGAEIIEVSAYIRTINTDGTWDIDFSYDSSKEADVPQLTTDNDYETVLEGGFVTKPLLVVATKIISISYVIGAAPLNPPEDGVIYIIFQTPHKLT